ncbi:hypothetical protein [Nocardioides yefusunii]|uniref:Apea-like HEPN domain-containing protein n=1 Tax=Nocardioides yefusunii TaxID=2500546 RepID=A0ABW1QV15_9ACTN|nr:hypothetical protein [Nocardioides yefusunii]
MTAPYDHDALFLKAKLFLNRALEEDEQSFDEKALWAALALELLAKAALARVSPLLIAEPNEEGRNLLIAAGLIEGTGQFTSVRAKTLYKRCAQAFKPFSSSEADKITNARNAYLHGPELRFTSLPPEQWWARYWTQASILVNATGRSLDELVGDREREVDRLLALNTTYMSNRVEMLVESARLRLAQHKAGNLPAKVAKEFTPNAYPLAVGWSHNVLHTCPACGAEGLLEGEEVIETDTHVERNSEEDYTSWVTLTVYSYAFTCSNCGLCFETPELVQAADLPETFEVDSEEWSQWQEPEYGND